MQVAVGGVPAETFASTDALRPLKDFDARIAFLRAPAAEGRPRVRQLHHALVRRLRHRLEERVLGRSGAGRFVVENRAVPGGFKELGVADVPSLCWFRKEITLPETLPQGSARIYLGNVDKMDTVYVNGQQVGSSSWVENPRVYFARGLKPGQERDGHPLVQRQAQRWIHQPRRHASHWCWATARRSRWPASGRARWRWTAIRRNCCRPDTKA